jgi:hypothetical protein
MRNRAILQIREGRNLDFEGHLIESGSGLPTMKA